MIEHGFLGIKYAKSYQWLHDKYKDQVQAQYQAQIGTSESGSPQPKQIEDSEEIYLLSDMQNSMIQPGKDINILDLNDNQLTTYRGKNEKKSNIHTLTVAYRIGNDKRDDESHRARRQRRVL